jgi:hypothetical protein
MAMKFENFKKKRKRKEKKRKRKKKKSICEGIGAKNPEGEKKMDKIHCTIALMCQRHRTPCSPPSAQSRRASRVKLGGGLAVSPCWTVRVEKSPEDRERERCVRSPYGGAVVAKNPEGRNGRRSCAFALMCQRHRAPCSPPSAQSRQASRWA